MKHTFLAACLALFATAATAQTETTIVTIETPDTTQVTITTDSAAGKKKYSLQLGSDGIKVEKNDTGKKTEPRFELQYGMLDLGFNRIHNPTGFALPGGNPDPFAIDGASLPLREGKSINVNVYPLLAKLRLSAAKRPVQNFYLTSGIGLQMYNFRFEQGNNYTDEPGVRIQNFDSLGLRKNKLGFTFLSVPLNVLGKTRLAPKATLVYGVGVMGGYRLASWTKFKNNAGDKTKNHDNFNFQDFNACLTGEIGVDDIIRLYATYQLTPLHMEGTGLDQRPFCIGVRFLGL